MRDKDSDSFIKSFQLEASKPESCHAPGPNAKKNQRFFGFVTHS
jgi:hypothetical protein